MNVVELLFKATADINMKNFYTATNFYGNTPLHYAAQKGHMNVAELLIKKSADVNAENSDGLTPLHGAAKNGHKDVVELLINNGADINAKDSCGKTPLHYAALNGHKDIASLINAKQASSPLHPPLLSEKNSVSFFERRDEKENNKPLPAFSPSHHQRL